MRRAAAVAAACAVALFPLALSGTVHEPDPRRKAASSESDERIANDIRALGDASWLSPDADIVAFLTRSPGECLRGARGEARHLVEIGRAAFRSPMLLGGVAARGGLSCNSCHHDGRSNPDFFLEGLSGAPGTADVTSSLLSKVRDDGRFNPLPIPDLVGAGGKGSFGSHGAASLSEFISDAVAAEFSGAPPQPSVIAGLAAYISALDPGDCPKRETVARVRTAMGDAMRAMSAAKRAMKQGDAAADLMLLAAAGELGRVHERLPTERFAAERLALAGLARDLQKSRGASDASLALKNLDQARRAVRRLSRRLEKAEGATFYDPATLGGALALDPRAE